VWPYVYHDDDGNYYYAGNTGTASLLSNKPTGSSNARMSLVYLDTSTGNPTILAGTTEFTATITGTAAVLQYIPSVPDNDDIALAGVRLVSGTSTIGWANLYDIRELLHEHPQEGTGNGGGGDLLIYDDSAFKVTGTAISFDDNLDVHVTGSVAYIEGQAGAQGPPGEPGGILVYDDSVFQVTGTSISFDDDLDVHVTGSVAYVESTATGADTTGWIDAGIAWNYASADDPTYIFDAPGNVTGTYNNGCRIKLTQTTDKFFIVTKTEFVSGTTTAVTMYGGTDYDLIDAAITSPQYSRAKSPQNFPLDPDKWSIEVTDTTLRSQSSPTNGTWYNLGSISIDIPIGIWSTYYRLSLQGNKASTTIELESTLSTSNNSESDANWTASISQNATSAFRIMVHICGVIDILVKDTYYLNSMSVQNSITTLYNTNTQATLVIKAICAYL
jgi:hypothetical protein